MSRTVDPMIAMLAATKMALRITTNAFDDELKDLINAGLADLGIAGVTEQSTENMLVRRAVITYITYVKMHFGEPDEYERIKASYDEQKAQMSMATGYTQWTEATS